MTSQILLKTKSVKLSSKQVERTTEPETKRPLVSNKFIEMKVPLCQVTKQRNSKKAFLLDNRMDV